MRLRDYQQDIIERARAEMTSGKRRVLVQLQTGGGKTAIAAHMIKTAAARKHVVWFVVHRRELIKQTMKTFDSIGIRHAVMSNGFLFDNKPNVQIVAIDSYRSRGHRYPEPTFIFVDETHHASAKTWSNMLDSYPNAWKIGLTATPWRLDGKGLSDFYDVMVEGPDTRWLIDNGYLADYKAYAPVTPDLSGISTSMGDYVKAELAERMSQAHIVGSAVAEYTKFAHLKRAIVFAVSIQHSETIVADFVSKGIPAEHVDGKTPIHEREAILERFRTGETLVMSNVGLFGEGFDVPDIECVILMRPTRSLSLYRQMVGRSLRPTENKQHAIILDHSGNISAHGLPCEEIEWTLSGKPKKFKSLGVKICPSCFAAIKQNETECPECGHSFYVERKGRDFSAIDGELKEVKVDEYKSRARKKFWREAYATHDFKELQSLCERYGYKPGYAYYVLKLKKGVGLRKPNP